MLPGALLVAVAFARTLEGDVSAELAGWTGGAGVLLLAVGYALYNAVLHGFSSRESGKKTAGPKSTGSKPEADQHYFARHSGVGMVLLLTGALALLGTAFGAYGDDTAAARVGGLICTVLGAWSIHSAFTDDESGGKKTPKSRKRRKSWSSTSGDAYNGSVYVLTNPELPDLVKIGYTTRSAAKRAKELSRQTGVPGHYEVAREIHVDRPRQVEKKVHSRLSNRRTSSGEFFKVSPEEAAETIKRVAT
jgi:hypothetical protein